MIQLLKVQAYVYPEEINELHPTSWPAEEYLVYTKGLVDGWHLIPTADLAKVLFP